MHFSVALNTMFACDNYVLAGQSAVSTLIRSVECIICKEECIA